MGFSREMSGTRDQRRSPGAIEFVPLSQIDVASLTELVNDRRVARHMPLSGEMSESDVVDWVLTKEAYSDKHGYGPSGILIEGRFAGWGGLQPWDDDVEIALVLRPEFWGWGRAVYEHITALAFGELQLPYLLVALPPTRARALGLLRLGFRRVEDTEIDGHAFTVYRLDAPSASTAT